MYSKKCKTSKAIANKIIRYYVNLLIKFSYKKMVKLVISLDIWLAQNSSQKNEYIINYFVFKKSNKLPTIYKIFKLNIWLSALKKQKLIKNRDGKNNCVLSNL